MRMHKNESGQVIVFVALAMAVLLGILALAVDAGVLQYERRQMQNVADDAASAGAWAGAYAGSSPTNRTSAAQSAGASVAAADGFTNGVNGFSLTVNNPPTSGPSSSNKAYFEAIASKSSSNWFARILGLNSSTVRARAVAFTGAKGGGCIYILNPTLSAAFTASGGSSVIASCGIVVDSSSSTGFTATSGTVHVAATQILVVGAGYRCDGTCTPTPTTRVAPVTDPLAYVPAPSVSCPHTPAVIPTGCSYVAKNGLVCNSTIGRALQADTYCGGINVSSAAKSVAFGAGTYILAGGGLTISGGVSATGTGVTFYNTVDPTSTAAFKPITISGGSPVTLIAPTSGDLASMLFFEDRNLASEGVNVTNVKNTISGGSTTNLQGSLYFKSTNLTYSGGSVGSALYTIIVADTATFSGGSYLGADYSSLAGGSPIIHVAMAE